jgi:hypothetical protein
MTVPVSTVTTPIEYHPWSLNSATPARPPLGFHSN